MKSTHRRPRLTVTTGGRGVVAHAGTRLLCDLADELGLTAGLSAAMAPTKRRRSGHDRGRVLVDLAVALADGATAISDLAVLAGQPTLFGEVASVPTAWRTLAAVDEEALGRIAAARAQARRRAWAAGMDPRFYVVDIDGTLLTSHSEKEGTAPTYKAGFGFHPLLAYLDGTAEPLAALLRAGNAGSGTAADHITVLDAALAQLPIDPKTTEVIARTDAAACSHEFLAGCRARGVFFVVGHALTQEIAALVVRAPRLRWIQAVSADGREEREGAEVAEVSDLVDLSAWPAGTRMIARREEPHPGGAAALHRHRRPPLPGVPHRPPGAGRHLPRGAVPRPGTRRVRHPRLEGHRPREPALRGPQGQRRLARPGPGRRRPPRLDG